MASAKFRVLKHRIAELRRHLLPARLPSVSGTYTKRQLDRARSFRLLTHAEIEAFLEDRVWTLARDAVSRYKSRREVGEILVHLIAFQLFQDPLGEQHVRQIFAGGSPYADTV